MGWGWRWGWGGDAGGGAFYPKASEYTFFSSAHGIFSRLDHMLGHKTNLSEFKKIEIISSIFSMTAL